ncbi:MAG TPA: hypothetical protein DCW68_07460 [Rhodospirillaceae bacterium]|nr:MAG: hypothetical protein A2018_06970 [Alphaproteobacteria bacterium GWF2_58_20]HAU29924.1 hypothetical protein [Rhodospirillaceae bacterium]
MDRKDFGAYAPDALSSFFMRQARRMPVTWLGRRFALILRKMVLLHHGGSIMDTEVAGIRMRAYLSGNVSERKFIFMPQFCDAFERGLLSGWLGTGDVFLDIGANAGIYTLAAAKTGARVFAFEPNPVMAARLLENVELNGFSSLVTLIPDALSDTEGHAAFLLPDDNFGEARLATEGSDEATVQVRTRRLANVLAEQGVDRVSAMKVDIEGGEERVLMDFFLSVPDNLWPGLIIIEDSVLSWPPASFARLQGFGYEVMARTRMNVVLERKTA